MENELINNQLINPEDEINSIIFDALEAILDSTMEDGMLKEMPIIGIATKILNAGKLVRDRIFYNKVVKFFKNIGHYSDKEKADFFERHNKDESARQRLGEQIVIYLDKFDNLEKPVLLAKAYGAYIQGKISFPEFLDLGNLISIIKTHYLSEIAVILVFATDLDYKSLPIGDTFKRFLPFCEQEWLLERNDEINEDNYGHRMITDKAILIPIVKYKSTKLARNFSSYIINDIYEVERQRINEHYKNVYINPNNLR
ncbi:hypothetical protein [Larkinella rosea]|uniref:Uncharacterized protein n=1 Tax=Larkinella rosea TaxID=2025312 RepID=A0A3P1BZM2_9BACT|nr:hypothetical protein [Larkinella rosea]RRB06316.1 hypothetical protein EHT25_00480 [Larkinella rosea]